MADHKTKKQELAEGSVKKMYTQKDILNVCATPSIDRIRWSIIKKGSQGKDHVDFSLKHDDMVRLCKELLSEEKIAAKKLAADVDSQYPSAYGFVGGNGGSKKLSIGGGQKGIRVQIMIKDSKPKMLVVPYTDLEDMAWYFMFVMDLLPKRPTSPYYDELYKAFWDGVEKNNSRFNQAEEVEDDYVPDLDENPSPAPAPEPEANPQTTTPALKRCSLFTTSQIKEWKIFPGSYMFQMAKNPLSAGKLAEGSPVVNVAISKETVDSLCEKRGKDWFESFKKNLNETFEAGASVKMGFIYYTDIYHSRNGDIAICYLQDILE